VLAEVEAIQRAALLAKEAGAKLHIVHVSSGRGVAVALEARARGTDVSIETCPHYLFFSAEDLERIGSLAKCAPPLRNSCERQAIWSAVLNGSVDVVGSDHSPAPPEMKHHENFFRVWGGIAAVQSTLPALLTLGLPVQSIAAMTAEAPARRFRIGRKGRIETGYDADLTLIDTKQKFTLTPSDLHQRHPTSPYVGCSFTGSVRHTIRRGELIYSEGAIIATTQGRFVRPA
jgi:allantoinase